MNPRDLSAADLSSPEKAFAQLPPEPPPPKPAAAVQPVGEPAGSGATAAPIKVELKNCTQVFETNGEQREVVRDISFEVVGNQTIAILGPSGCGKSTILKMISGIHPRGQLMPTRGECTIDGEPVTGPRDEVLTVFQTPVLAGWLTVLGNVLLAFRPLLYGPRPRYPWEVLRDWGVALAHRLPFLRGKLSYSKPYQEILAQALKILKAVGLEDSMHKYPHQLSGGMRQRAALATSLVVRPKILCMDEPFSALDPTTRIEMRRLIRQLRNDYQCMILFVTHDVSEALDLADRVLVLSTRPATILGDFRLPASRPPDWLTSPEQARLETTILQMIREAKGNGNLTVGV